MTLRLLLPLTLLLLTSGCSQDSDKKTETPAAEITTLKSTLSRETPDASTTDLTSLRENTGSFAFKLYSDRTILFMGKVENPKE